MPTPKQERAARNIIEKHSYKEALIEAGYSANTAKAPTMNVIGTKGFKEAAKPLVDKLQAEIDAIMEALPGKRGKAGYGEMGTVLKTLIDKKELLSGKPTQIFKVDRLDELTNSELERIAARSPANPSEAQASE